MVQKIDDALAIIANADPRRYQRIARDVRAVLITKAGGPEFVPQLCAYLLGYELVKHATPLGLAFMIVHEATHARLWKPGFRYEPGSGAESSEYVFAMGGEIRRPPLMGLP